MSFWISTQECQCSEERRSIQGQVRSEGNIYCKSCRKRIGPLRERPDEVTDTSRVDEPGPRGTTIKPADLTAGRHTAWVKRVEPQVSVSANGLIQRALVIWVRGSRGPVWVAGPQARLPKAEPVLRLESNETFDQLKVALQPERSSITWWEQEGEVSQLIVRSWTGGEKGDGLSLGVGVGVVFPID